MVNVVEFLIADSWGSGFSIASMFLVIALAVHQIIKVSIKSGILTLVAGAILVNGLLALGTRLI